MNKMLDRSPRRSVSDFRDRVGGNSVNMVVRPLKICKEGIPKILKTTNSIVQTASLVFMLMFAYGCHFGEERLQFPTGTRVFPTEIPNSVMGSHEVLTLPTDIRIERFGDESNGLWRFIYPNGTVKHKDQNGKDVVVHGGII